MLADEAGTPAGKVVGTLTEGLLAAIDGLGVEDAGGGGPGLDDAVMARDGLGKLLRLWPPPLEDCLDDCLLLLLGLDGSAVKYNNEVSDV